jgi:hypothetical protein
MEYLERPTKSATDGILLDRLSGTWGTSETKKNAKTMGNYHE